MRRVLRWGYGGVLLTMLIVLGILGVLLLTEPPPPEPEITVVGGEIESNESAVWKWTQNELGRQVASPPDISIRNVSAADVSSTAGLGGFEALLVGNASASELEGSPPAVARPPTFVRIDPGSVPGEWNDSATTQFNQLLAHEFTHLVQYDSEVFLQNRPDAETPTDERLAWLALAEGSATYVADRYADNSRIEPLRERWRNPATTVAERYMLWPYLRGAEYAEATLDDPSELWSLYGDPPQSTDTILKGQEDGGGTPDRQLEVELEDHSVWQESTVGAAFVESALASTADADRANSIAANWRWDTAVRIRKGDDGGVDHRWVWVTEWDDEAAADGFESEMTAFFDDRWSQTNGTWDHPTRDRSAAIERVDADAVAVQIGSEAFLANATVTTTADGYSVVPATSAESVGSGTLSTDTNTVARAGA
ncbi:hypothetical protein GCM10028857_15290 [Salinarchaeum chitinilyticum]